MSVNAKATITEVYCAFTQKQDIRSSVFVVHFLFLSVLYYQPIFLGFLEKVIKFPKKEAPHILCSECAAPPIIIGRS